MSDQRAVPFYCPFCGDEDLRPHDAQHGAWHCRSCTRVFGLRMVGLAAPAHHVPTATSPRSTS